MDGAPKITNNLQNKNFYFDYFEGLLDYNETCEKYMNELKNFDGYSSAKDWAAKIKRQTGAERTGQFTDYVDKPALKNAIDCFDEVLAQIDMGGAFKKSRIIFTENKMGIFDFGLASKGLFQVKEFFSEKLKKEHPFEYPTELPGIVPNEWVEENRFGDFFYTSKQGEKYQMTQQNKGQEAMNLKLPDAKYEYRTTTKKAYIMFEKDGGISKYVDLYVICGGNYDLQSSGMLARAMPVLMAAQYFESVQIKTRINASRMYRDGNGIVNCCWTIKDFGDAIDFNRIAIDTSDTRFFRNRNWANISAMMALKYQKSSPGWGTAIYDATTIQDVSNRYKNWYYEQMKDFKVPNVEIPKPLMLFGGLDNPPDSWNYTGRKDRVYEAITKEFYRILDIVDFQYNNAKDCAKRIYQRNVVENGQSVYNYKRYITDTLSRAYSYPTKGQYADTGAEQEEMITMYDRRIDEMLSFLQTLQQD